MSGETAFGWGCFQSLYCQLLRSQQSQRSEKDGDSFHGREFLMKSGKKQTKQNRILAKY
jgi:hypothetical protein